MPVIITPAIIRVVAVAADGTAVVNAVNGTVTINSNPVIIAVNPVLAPSTTPVFDST